MSGKQFTENVFKNVYKKLSFNNEMLDEFWMYIFEFKKFTIDPEAYELENSMK